MEPAKICFIYPDTLGDIVRAFPAIHTFKKLNPQVRIYFALSKHFADIAALNSDIDEILFFENGCDTSLEFAAAVNFHQSATAEDYLNSLNTGVKAGWNGVNWLPFSGIKNFELDDIRNKINRLYFNFFLLNMQPDNEIILRLNVVHSAILKKDEHPIIIQPDCGNNNPEWFGKRYSVNLFHEIIMKLSKLYSERIFIIGSTAETDNNKLLDDLCGEQIINLTGKTNIKELCFLLSSAKLYIGGDTGPAHIAAGLGVPVISLFGFTSPILNAPIGRKTLIMQADKTCAFQGCPIACEFIDCLKKIDSDAVMDAVRILNLPVSDNIILSITNNL